jgi:hypothetical protein
MTCSAWYDIPCWISVTLAWLFDMVLWLPRKIVALLLDGLGQLVEAIPAPAALQAFADNASGALSSVSYLSDVFQIPFGMALMGGTYLARFLLRRIPFIG